MVQDQRVKDELAQEAMLGPGNKFRVRDSSVLAVFLSDLEAEKRTQRIYQLEKKWGERHPAYMAMMPLSTSFMLGQGHAATLVKQLTTDFLSDSQPMPQIDPIQSWSYKNTALAVQTYVLAASSHGLGTSLMEGYDARRVKEILRIPDRYALPMMVGTGYDYEENGDSKLTPRLELEEMVFGDSFGEPWAKAAEETDSV
jgi:nitroreductase